MTTIPFEPRRFRSAASYYGRFRTPYPDDLVAAVTGRVRLSPGDRVLDLGSGPAPLGIAFARLGMRVTAMDPEPEMLASARAAMVAAGVTLDLVEGSSYDLPGAIGPVSLVAMGRAFHWMDRAATLDLLDRMIEPAGAVVLFHERRVHAAPDWRAVLETVSAAFDRGEPSARAMRRSPGWEPHEALLFASAFSRIESVGRFVRQERTLDEVVGRVFSMSSTSPEALGSEHARFERRLRSELAELSADGRFSEIVEMAATIAFRH